MTQADRDKSFASRWADSAHSRSNRSRSLHCSITSVLTCALFTTQIPTLPRQPVLGTGHWLSLPP